MFETAYETMSLKRWQSTAWLANRKRDGIDLQSTGQLKYSSRIYRLMGSQGVKVDVWMTQLLNGHECFQAYFLRFKIESRCLGDASNITDKAKGVYV